MHFYCTNYAFELEYLLESWKFHWVNSTGSPVSRNDVIPTYWNSCRLNEKFIVARGKLVALTEKQSDVKYATSEIIPLYNFVKTEDTLYY